MGKLHFVRTHHMFLPKNSGSPSLLQLMMLFLPKLIAGNPFVLYFPRFSCGFPSNSRATSLRFPWPLCTCALWQHSAVFLHTSWRLDPGLDSPSALMVLLFPFSQSSCFYPVSSSFSLLLVFCVVSLDCSSPVYFTSKSERFLSS